VTVATYRYDGLGRRVLVTFYDELGAPESVTRYLYDGSAVVQEYVVVGSWVLDAEYVHGLGTDNVLTITRDGSTWYYHYDGLGSVTELTDSTGALAQAYEYDAWGIPTIYDPTSSIGNPYLYTGRRWDAPISLYYYRARHYNPATGRFIQPDPIGYDDGPNLYTYVSNSPTVFVDPTGMEGGYHYDLEEEAYVTYDHGPSSVYATFGVISNDNSIGVTMRPRRLGEPVPETPLGGGNWGEGLIEIGKATLGVVDSVAVGFVDFFAGVGATWGRGIDAAAHGENVIKAARSGPNPFAGERSLGRFGDLAGIEDHPSYIRGEGVGRTGWGAVFTVAGAGLTETGWGALPGLHLMGHGTGEYVAGPEQIVTGKRVPNSYHDMLYDAQSNLGVGLSAEEFETAYETATFASVTASMVNSAARSPRRPFANSRTLTETHAKGTTTGENLSVASARAHQTVGTGRGPVHGTRVHTAFKGEVKASGNPNVVPEQSYLNGRHVPYGTRGSIRVDVVEGPLDAPTAVWDLKTGGAKLTPARIRQIQQHLPLLPDGSKPPVYEVH